MKLTATASTFSQVELADRVARYIAACPPAISGNNGHGQTFFVACKLVNGFDLSESDALSWLQQYNQRCDPPWSQKELEHKIKEAGRVVHTKPRGHMLNGEFTDADCRAPAQPKHQPGPTYNTAKPTPIPDPNPDATLTLLLRAFQDDEGVAICPAVAKGDRCIPAGSGTVHSRREWLDKLDAVGNDANNLFPNTTQGVFIRVNPLKLGGSKDADVTAFRHALIEFDKCSMQEQWNIITQSGIPCTAVLTSGNRSLHAWVRVDAKDATEYAHRVGILFDHFADYGVDRANKNPSRFSRLPGVRRDDKQQELLAVGIGAHSFTQWICDAAAAGIGEEFKLEDLLRFDPKQDKDSILGNRWVCRGGSCLWVGQSGIGKSSLGMQAAITWALGDPLFGVKPARPLKSLIIQAENDLGDTSEMLSGVINGFTDKNVSEVTTALRERLVIIRDQSHVGRSFADAAQKLIDKHKPDLVWVDPMFAFFGDDVSNQRACTEFLRTWLNPIAQSTGIVWMLLHHTGKPSKDPKAYGTWKNTDFSYMGTGSAELVNWARAVVYIKGVDEGEFQLLFTKRGARAGSTDPDGTPSRDIYIRHAEHSICWIQADPPPIDPDSKLGQKHDLFALAESLGVGQWRYTDLISHIKVHCSVGVTQAKTILKHLKPLLITTDNGTYEANPEKLATK